MNHTRAIAILMPLLVAACAQPTRLQPVDATGQPRADVNASYRPGQINLPDAATPTLAEMQNLQKRAKPAAVSDEDRLRAPALRDAALSYGVRGGLAWASKQINLDLNAEAENLSRTWDFNPLLIKAQSGQTVLPPVISQSNATYEQNDAGRTLRVADTYYQIIEQARFAPNAPLWHTYLLRTYTSPEPPPDALLPKNDGERDLWRKFVAEGWEQGVKQARDIFKEDLSRLNRDFTGMVRYSQLLDDGKVSAPVVAETNMGVTGTGQDARYNDRVLRITQDPRLTVQHTEDIKASPSELSPTDAATPPGDTPGIVEH
jgi:defect-in-organelle-trafficking protein DotC